jgi:hypothetical protein
MKQQGVTHSRSKKATDSAGPTRASRETQRWLAFVPIVVTRPRGAIIARVHRRQAGTPSERNDWLRGEESPAGYNPAKKEIRFSPQQFVIQLPNGLQFGSQFPVVLEPLLDPRLLVGGDAELPVCPPG